MKKKILIISGGISKERLISLDTGQQVANELKKNGYRVKITEPDNNLEKNIKFFKPNIIFNALHGQFGEDGYIQTILETFKIPYTHSGVVASSIAMDKEVSKKRILSACERGEKMNAKCVVIHAGYYQGDVEGSYKRIEKALKIRPLSLWDNLKPMYNVTDTAALLGCSVSRVRKYLKFGMLQELRLGRRKMIDSKSIKKVYEDNLKK